ncbi:TetR/AcrR family transcriptional regulator [Deinococcus sp.]|uniref:TetR/AcrR family transcriptional regulator n=1 Tax=Deinococcus sp. TaxID=47478 RepID=UPI003CC68A1D
MPVALSARQSADERRVSIVEAAVEEFALHGYVGTSTEAIAKRAGISQPYIFRLFGTKRELFLAAAGQVNRHILALFEAAAGAAGRGATPLERMANAYSGLLPRRHELLMLLQAFAASGDPEIQSEIRAGYRQLFQRVQELSGASPAALFEFFAAGMMLTISAALDMPELQGEAPSDC